MNAAIRKSALLRRLTQFLVRNVGVPIYTYLTMYLLLKPNHPYFLGAESNRNATK